MAHTLPTTTHATHTVHTVSAVPSIIGFSNILSILALPEPDQGPALSKLIDDGLLPPYDTLSKMQQHFGCKKLYILLVSHIALMIHRGDKRITREYITMISPLLNFSRQPEVCALKNMIEEKYNPKPATVADVVKLYMGKHDGMLYESNPKNCIKLHFLLASIPPNVFYKLPPSH